MQPILSINTRAIQDNYLYMQSICKAEIGASVKADCYGLGAKAIVQALYEAGCRRFFVSTLQEGIEMREVERHCEASTMPRQSPAILMEIAARSSIARNDGTISIHILNGFLESTIPTFLEHNLIPIINNPEQLALWPPDHPCIIHIDTGMNRLGINLDDFEKVTSLHPKTLFLMSHLACDGDVNNHYNQQQLNKFLKVTALYPNIPRSLAASGGVFLGEKYHFDLARVGAALYGLGSRTHNGLQNPVSLKAPIIQIRKCADDEYVGYGATKLVKKGTMLATIPVGYADGFSRFFSSNGVVYIKNKPAEIIGRVSMDLTIIDVTGHDVSVGEHVELLGPNIYPDDIANKIGTIGYEILTSLKNGRFKRQYVRD